MRSVRVSGILGDRRGSSLMMVLVVFVIVGAISYIYLDQYAARNRQYHSDQVHAAARHLSTNIFNSLEIPATILTSLTLPGSNNPSPLALYIFNCTNFSNGGGNYSFVTPCDPALQTPYAPWPGPPAPGPYPFTLYPPAGTPGVSQPVAGPNIGFTLAETNCDLSILNNSACRFEADAYLAQIYCGAAGSNVPPCTFSFSYRVMNSQWATDTRALNADCNAQGTFPTCTQAATKYFHFAIFSTDGGTTYTVRPCWKTSADCYYPPNMN